MNVGRIRKPKQIWIVEHRMLKKCPHSCFDTVVMFIASSKKKAEKWIKEQTKENYGNDWFWWAVFNECINKEIGETNVEGELFYYYKDGTPALVYQPTTPEEAPYHQEEEEY